MKLIQIFLPLYNSKGVIFKEALFEKIKAKITEDFGGLTAYQRSPAIGLWKEDDKKTVKDDIIIYEVMAEKFEKIYWKKYKTELENVFSQDVIIIRVMNIQLV
ncbi:MAG: hypothetical protein H7329_06060 [Opitutaceae bacterium]|nr:hypothetical protein [Cytophagales bacterium]